jgi:hypothetical protein
MRAAVQLRAGLDRRLDDPDAERIKGVLDRTDDRGRRRDHAAFPDPLDA